MPYDDDSSLKKSLMQDGEPVRDYVDESAEEKKKKEKKLSFMEWLSLKRKNRESAIDAALD